jgi:hypothetical protein
MIDLGFLKLVKHLKLEDLEIAVVLCFSKAKDFSINYFLELGSLL